jgi:hypothetical protein
MENQEQAQLVSDGVAPADAPKPPELSIADLQNIRTIIDAASKRGAFGAAELSSVGSTFDRLNAFLNSVAPPPADPAAPPANQPAA